jgi:ribose 5-phosphate isomerase B
MRKKIALASDHAGFGIKEDVKNCLEKLGYETIDFGTYSLDSVDYPDFGKKAVESILDGRAHSGILVCGSGVGMSIVANRYPGIRAALAPEPKTAEMARKHNDANVLVLPGWKLTPPLVREILDAWFSADFEGGRHQRRLDKIMEIEKSVRKSIE